MWSHAGDMKEVNFIANCHAGQNHPLPLTYPPPHTHHKHFVYKRPPINIFLHFSMCAEWRTQPCAHTRACMHVHHFLQRAPGGIYGMHVHTPFIYTVVWATLEITSGWRSPSELHSRAGTWTQALRVYYTMWVHSPHCLKSRLTYILVNKSDCTVSSSRLTSSPPAALKKENSSLLLNTSKQVSFTPKSESPTLGVKLITACEKSPDVKIVTSLLGLFFLPLPRQKSLWWLHRKDCSLPGQAACWIPPPANGSA